MPSRDDAKPPTDGGRGLIPAVSPAARRARFRRRPTRARMLAAFGVAVVLVSLAGVALAATAKTETATAAFGTTSATVTYLANPAGGAGAPFSDVRLEIRRDGRTAFDAAVRAPLCGLDCWPDIYPGHSFLAVADLQANGSPDVVVDLYSGGAHCCSIVAVYRYDRARGGYRVLERDFGDPGAALERLDGAYVFRSADDRFAYAFAAFAFSGLPIEVWSVRARGFVDVTRRHPALIARDAAGQYHAYLANRSQHFGLGFLAAWAADEDLLGHSSLVARRLATESRAGRLRSVSGWPSGHAFITALQRSLARWGYTG